MTEEANALRGKSVGLGSKARFEFSVTVILIMPCLSFSICKVKIAKEPTTEEPL